MEIPASSSVKLVYGIGINDSGYRVSSIVNGKRVSCPYYSAWANMLNRCYGESMLLARPGYSGVKVCDEWLVFSKFREWMEAQDWEGKQLDKDILTDEAVYSPSTCAFVSSKINMLVRKDYIRTSSLPKGVHRDKKKYKVRVRLADGVHEKGGFESIFYAKDYYLNLTSIEYIRIALSQEAKVFKALIRRAASMRKDLNISFA